MTTEMLTLTDGRRVAYDVTGPEDGPVVVLFHSAPGSRRFDPDPDATRVAGVRLVTVDRPGYGASDELPAGTVPTIPGYAADTAAVLDHLGATDALLAGWSAGGRVAAALAAARPDLARALVIIATPAPDDEVPWIPADYRPAIAAMRADPSAAVAQMTAILGGAASESDDGTASVTGGEADDTMLAAHPELRPRLEAMLAEGVGHGPAGAAADIVSYTVADWGFDPASIGAPTTCIYGGADGLVPPAHGNWWATRIPEARVEVVDGAGHLVIFPAWPTVLELATTG